MSFGTAQLEGGIGNDTYDVSDAANQVIENPGEGTDLVNASISYTLGANVENLTLTGSAAINGTGNGLNNAITGNAAANTLDGGAGADTMIGGAGNDTLRCRQRRRHRDRERQRGHRHGAGAGQLHAAANVENLTLTGSAAINGTGNALDNAITGNAAANVLDGGAGADTLSGGLGNDTYVVDNAGGRGDRERQRGHRHWSDASVSYTLADNVENLTLTGSAAINGTGNALANVMRGNCGERARRRERQRRFRGQRRQRHFDRRCGQ